MARRASQPFWCDYDNESLLTLRFCELRIRIPGSWVEPRIDKLYEELDSLGFVFRPHCWFSSEWFSPDRIPGIAVPFYLAHPRLMKLEQRQMLQVEGGNQGWCMRILRHETGHAIDSAYQLHRRKRWRELFGRFSKPYPDYYRPKVNSREYVQHLNGWYAQAHPAEDFAETFAVWMRPGWRSRYKGWPALRKLEYVDELMDEISCDRPRVRARDRPESVASLRKRLREHYRERRLHYLDEWPEFFDRELFRLFSHDPSYRKRPTGARFLRSVRRDVREHVARWTGVHPYTIDQVVSDMIDRCKELRLRLAIDPPDQAVMETKMMVTVQTMRYLHEGRYRIAV